MNSDLNPIQKAILEKFETMTMKEVNAFLNGNVRPAIKTPARAAAPAGRRPKRTAEQIEQEAGAILELLTVVLAKHPEGLRSELLQKEAGVDKEAFQEAAKLGLKTGRLTKQGEKRATEYFAPKSKPIPEKQMGLPTVSSAIAQGRVTKRPGKKAK